MLYDFFSAYRRHSYCYRRSFIGSQYLLKNNVPFQVYGIGFPTTDAPKALIFRTIDVQQHMVQLFDLVNNLSYRLHKFKKWSPEDLTLLEKDLKLLLVRWEKLNAIAQRFGHASDLVSWGRKEKVGALNTIVSTIRNFGALRFLSSAIGEKAHQMPKHCLEMSKGVNKDTNSLKQAMRIEYSDLRGVFAEIQKVHVAEERITKVSLAKAKGVVFRGHRTFEDVLRDAEDSLVARICHLIREEVQAQVGEAGREAVNDLVALEDMIPAQPSTPAGKSLPPVSHRHALPIKALRTKHVQ